MDFLRRFSVRLSLLMSGLPLLAPVRALAADLGGTGDVTGLASGTDVRAVIIKILQAVLSFIALLAVIFIIVAGIRLIVSQGEDTEKAKKTIIYVIVGLIVVLLAKVIVSFVFQNVT